MTAPEKLKFLVLEPILHMSNVLKQVENLFWLNGPFPHNIHLRLKIHNCDSNYILEEPLKLRSESEILWELTAIYKHITYHGLQLCLQILYNEWSTGMENFILSAGDQHQLVPLGLHRTLIAEW